MKKILFAIVCGLLLVAEYSHAAQKTITVGTSGSPASLDTNFGNAQDNFNELYTFKGLYPASCSNDEDTIEWDTTTSRFICKTLPTLDVDDDADGLVDKLDASITTDAQFTGAITVGDGGDLIKTIYDSTPATDDTWAGASMTITAGESLAQWDLLYAKNASGTLKWYKYDANGTDKLLAPRAIALAAISADATGSAGIGDGIARNDGWAMTTNQDEGKDVWASGTAGALTLTKLSTSGDEVARLGYVLEENVILFSLGNVTLVEVP